MDRGHFDGISKLFAERKLSRRRAMTGSAAGLAAAGLGAVGLTAVSAQDSTPAADEPEAEHGPTMLFVQTFQSGVIAPKEGTDDRYILELDGGAGQTIYFSDRPDRIVGSSDTVRFLEGLGFPDDNPPNAAIVVETGPGMTDIGVLELFSPTYNPVTKGVTYEVAFLDNWESSLDMGFTHAPTALPEMATAFGAASLFIDDCPDDTITCAGNADFEPRGTIANSEHDGYCYSWSDMKCLPCQPWHYYEEAFTYWSSVCNERFAECENDCFPASLCSAGFGCKRW